MYFYDRMTQGQGSHTLTHSTPTPDGQRFAELNRAIAQSG